MVESNSNCIRWRIPQAHCGRIMAGRTKGMRRAILATVLIAVFLATPSFVFGFAKRSLSTPSGTVTTSTLTSHKSLILSSILAIPRGGAMGRKGGKGSMYVKALQDEILYLEQTLRRVEQEKSSLKKKLSNRQVVREGVTKSKGRKGGKNKLEKHEEDFLRLANIERLDKQKESLLTAKAQLEKIKLDYDQKLQALQSDLLKSRSRNSNLEKTFLARVKELESSLKKVRDAAANPKIYGDAELSQKINEACQAAITEFWIEGNQKLREHEQQLKARHEQDLLEERRLATLAVDKQRQKMRALARATAIREKEVAAKRRELSRQMAQEKSKPKRPSDKKRDEKLEREQLKAIRDLAERKAKEEEERMWLELEHELEQEREKLNRMKQREEEEKLRCEQEEMERRRLLQQHALDLEKRLRKEQEQAAAGDFGGGGRKSVFGKVFGTRGKNRRTTATSDPTIASIENYQRRVMWQPISLPPKEKVRITGPK